MGTIMPYVPILLSQRGLSTAQVGIVLAAAGVAVIISPVAMTLVADVHLQGRTLLAMLFVATAAAIGAMIPARGFEALLPAYLLFALVYMPMLPLQDGLNFGLRQRGRQPVPYHRIRVWGTIGFMVPAVLLYLLLDRGWGVQIILYLAIGACVLGLCNTWRLPQLEAIAGEGDRGDRRLPTLEAGRQMLRPRLLTFCLAMWLLQMVSSSLNAFYPLYLTQTLHVADRWVGLITNLGVAIEIFYMLAFGWMLRRVGLFGFMLLGTVTIALRMALLFAVPTVAVAVATQAVHGLGVLVVNVAPIAYLNHHAQDRYRNSIQGLYAMAVSGTGRIAGNVIAGQIATFGILKVFGFTTLVALAALPLLAVALWRESQGKTMSL